VFQELPLLDHGILTIKLVPFLDGSQIGVIVSAVHTTELPVVSTVDHVTLVDSVIVQVPGVDYIVIKLSIVSISLVVTLPWIFVDVMRVIPLVLAVTANLSDLLMINVECVVVMVLLASRSVDMMTVEPVHRPKVAVGVLQELPPENVSKPTRIHLPARLTIPLPEIVPWH